MPEKVYLSRSSAIVQVGDGATQGRVTGSYWARADAAGSEVPAEQGTSQRDDADGDAPVGDPSGGSTGTLGTVCPMAPRA